MYLLKIPWPLCTHLRWILAFIMQAYSTSMPAFQITHIEFIHTGDCVYNSDGILKLHSDLQFEFIM